MRIQIKERSSFSDKRIDSFRSKIENVVIKEDLLNPEKERVVIYFRSRNSSGVLHLRVQEMKELMETLKPYTELVKRKKR